MINTYIRDISEALVQGHAALMVGAGFSKNAKKITATDKRFLDWKELSDQDTLCCRAYNLSKP